MESLEGAGRPIGRTAISINVLDVFDQAFDHRVMVEEVPRGMHLIQASMRFWPPGHKERAAVGSGLAANVIGTDLLGTRDDLLLVCTDKRAKHRDVHNLVNGSNVLEGLRCDLSQGCLLYTSDAADE